MGTEPPKPARATLLLAFATIYILWGSTYLAMRLAIDTLPPFLMAGTRFIVAGATLYFFSSRAGTLRPTIRQWRNAAIAALALFVVGNGGVAWAQQHVPTGSSALIVATLPVWLLLLDWSWGGRKRPRSVEVLGLGLGLAGVAVLSAPGGINPTGAAVLLIAAIAWGIGSLFSRYADRPESPVRTSAMQMLVGGAIMIGVSLAFGEGRRLDFTTISVQSCVALAYLIAVALVALPAYNWLLTITSPALVGTYAFVNPVVAVVLGWAAVAFGWVAGDETPTVRTGIAGVLVVFGVMLLVWPRSANVDKSQKSPLGIQPATIGEKGDERQDGRMSAD